MGKMTIDDLLDSLDIVSKTTLENTRETWTRIAERDKFAELDLKGSELEDFLREWINENPYSNI